MIKKIIRWVLYLVIGFYLITNKDADLITKLIVGAFFYIVITYFTREKVHNKEREEVNKYDGYRSREYLSSFL